MEQEITEKTEILMCGQNIVPEGHLAIAQRFSVGFGRQEERVPKGRLNRRTVPIVPSGLDHGENRDPTLKRWAILKHPFGMELEWPCRFAGKLSIVEILTVYLGKMGV